MLFEEIGKLALQFTLMIQRDILEARCFTNEVSWPRRSVPFRPGEEEVVQAHRLRIPRRNRHSVQAQDGPTTETPTPHPSQACQTHSPWGRFGPPLGSCRWAGIYVLAWCHWLRLEVFVVLNPS